MAIRSRLAVALAAIVALALLAASALATPSSGIRAERLGSVLIDTKVDHNAAGIRVKTTKPVEVFTQRLTFSPGGTSGWHHHPGVVFVSVVEGALAFYDDKCARQTFAAGSGWADYDRKVHLARNEGSTDAVVQVTYVRPAPTPRLPNFVDEPAPAGCAVR